MNTAKSFLQQIPLCSNKNVSFTSLLFSLFSLLNFLASDVARKRDIWFSWFSKGS